MEELEIPDHADGARTRPPGPRSLGIPPGSSGPGFHPTAGPRPQMYVRTIPPSTRRDAPLVADEALLHT